ncbi:stage III sporulation protein SpoIIIAB [Clostridium peptidivorans]|uniref:stage III sporulation protein SpoIIIAB n=1 Tax=Clostridium peptidivorans TaxID=100174 RepID=UPI000BE2B6FC|nr:stage III sporulation protein SpoIIIAB [Clostridium peptidivorans]
MIKIIGSVLVIVSTSLLGYFFGELFKKRTRELKELERAIGILKNEIVYAYTPLPYALEKIGLRIIEPIKTLFLSISKDLKESISEGVYEAFYSNINLYKKSFNLNEEDIRILLNLSKSLGEWDVESQKNIFRVTEEELRKQIEESEILTRKNLKMYRYLGFSIGAIIVIMFI